MPDYCRVQHAILTATHAPGLERSLHVIPRRRGQTENIRTISSDACRSTRVSHHHSTRAICHVCSHQGQPRTVSAQPQAHTIARMHLENPSHVLRFRHVIAKPYLYRSPGTVHKQAASLLNPFDVHLVNLLEASPKGNVPDVRTPEAQNTFDPYEVSSIRCTLQVTQSHPDPHSAARDLDLDVPSLPPNQRIASGPKGCKRPPSIAAPGSQNTLNCKPSISLKTLNPNEPLEPKKKWP